MNDIQENSIVLIPRTGGGVSIGIVDIYNGVNARVKFPIGSTFRGKENQYRKDEWGSKIVPIQDLKPVSENIRINFGKK